MIFGGVDPSTTTFTVALLDGASAQTAEGLTLPEATHFLEGCERVTVEQPFAHFVVPGTLIHVLQTLEAAVTLRVALNFGFDGHAFKASVQEIRSEPWGELTALELARPTKGVKADDAMLLWLKQVWLPGRGWDEAMIAAAFKNTGLKPKHGPLSNSHKRDALLAAIHAQRVYSSQLGGHPTTEAVRA